jgi:hypothetical protein
MLTSASSAAFHSIAGGSRACSDDDGTAAAAATQDNNAGDELPLGAGSSSAVLATAKPARRHGKRVPYVTAPNLCCICVQAHWCADFDRTCRAHHRIEAFSDKNHMNLKIVLQPCGARLRHPTPQCCSHMHAMTECDSLASSLEPT